MEGRPRRVPFEYRNSRDREKEEKTKENIDPFGVVDEAEYLNEFGDEIENKNEKKEKKGGGAVNWLDDVDNLHLPSRAYNEKKNEEKYKERNDCHAFLRIYDRNKGGDTLKNKKINEELELEKIKANRLQSELDRLKNKKEMHNSKNVLQFVNNISYNSLELGKKIGQGGFSEIYESEWLGIPVAVKVIFDPNITEALLEEFNNEIEKLFILRHPYIVQLYGICGKDKSQKLAVITELVQNGSLFEYLHKNPNTKNNLSLDFKNKITKQLISTMAYIHSRGYVHRDLKTQNILLDNNLNMKMCDFGLTKLKSELNTGSGQFAGTPCYMAPELFERKYYDEKVDVFAFGTVLWEIYTQKVPYAGCDAMEIKQKVTKGEELYCPTTVPKQITELINKCRSLKASDRPSFEEIEKMKIV